MPGSADGRDPPLSRDPKGKGMWGGGGRQEGEEEKGEGRGGARSAVRASAFESPRRVREGGGRSCSGGEVAWKDSRSLLSGVPPL